MAQNLQVLTHLTSKCASHHNDVHFFDIEGRSDSQKVARTCGNFNILLKMCFAPQRHTLFRHLNFQKWPERVIIFTFSLPNVLGATTACTFSTSQPSKSGPRPSYYDTFYFKLCFAPQRRALFQHLNFQKSSEIDVL